MRNQNGVGLVTVLIAAGLIVIAALVVGSFVTGQKSHSMKVEISGSCQNIANSVIEYITKDESSLWISSYGPRPGTATFASNLDKTADGLDRFVFKGVPAPLFMGPPGFTMSLANGGQALPAGWKYFNSLNIKNSTNRLIALAANGNFCCSKLDVNDPNCGDIFISDTISRPGFTIAEKNVGIKLGINFTDSTGSLCKSRQLSVADLIDSRFMGTTQFQVQVTAGKGTDSEKKCNAESSVIQNLDQTPSLVLMELQNQAGMCGGKGGIPSNCNPGSDVVYKVRTVKSSSGTSCETQCLSQINNKNCSAIAPGSLSLFNVLANPSCTANCSLSEPGSAFLCKVGEKNWFTNHPNHWEPCEIAKIYDFDNLAIPGSKVTIQYTNTTSSETSTDATITLSGLRANRAYVFDVRAIDTKGNVGPSFCNNSPSCDSASDPQFVVIPSSPTIGNLSDEANFVNTTGKQRRRDVTLTSKPKYTNALSPFGANQFQCVNGDPEFSLPVSYSVPVGAYGGFMTANCTASLTDPGGGTTAPPCVCQNGKCNSQLPVETVNGNYKFSMNVKNDCGGAGMTATQNWCMDNNLAIGITNSGNKVFGPSPDFSTYVNYPSVATKACGIVSLCPNVNGGFTPVLGACPNATINWNTMVHSGCLADPLNNYCMIAMDPCGRSQETTPIQYSTTLLAVPFNAATPTHMCYAFGVNQVCGNNCGPGSYCSASGKCFSTCANPPCPSNKNTPTAINSGNVYCPTLNSCLTPIGGTPSSNSCGAVLISGACNPATDGKVMASAPNSNLCSSGTPTAVLGTGPWNWNCLGSGGGGNASCTAFLNDPGIWCAEGLEDTGCSTTPCPAPGATCSNVGSEMTCQYQVGPCVAGMTTARKKICQAGPGPCMLPPVKNNCPVRCPVGYVIDPSCRAYSQRIGDHCHLCGPNAPICY